MSSKPAFWIVLAILSAGSAALAVRVFPRAFPIVQLEITMDRSAALATAERLMARERLGPRNYDQAASFSVDTEAQMFVELEGGGRDAYARMLRDGLYSPYTWGVRHFREGEKHETLIRFRPDGRPYGFSEQLAEAEPGPELTAAAARATAERRARESWQIDVALYALVESSLVRRPGGRVDHTFIYERVFPRLNDGRYRLRLVVSGDRLTEATHFILIPQASSRRYQEMRAANAALGAGSIAVMALLYGIGGIAGLFYLARHRWVIARTPLLWGVAVAGLQLLVAINDWPLLWMTYDTAVSRTGFALQQIAMLATVFAGSSAAFGVSFMAAESLTRRAFGNHPQLWRVWSREAAASRPILGRTVAGYLLATVFLAYDVVLYFFVTRLFGWWMPSETLIHPAVLASNLPWLSAIANALQAGFWEESLLRAVPIAGAALIGDRFGRRRLFIVVAIVCQALLFGAGHATSPMQPAYARAVELILPSIGFGLLYLAFGLMPAILVHFAFDLIWFAMPLFVSTASGLWLDRAIVMALTFVPLWIVLAARLRQGRWGDLPDAARNAAWEPPIAAAVTAEPPARARLWSAGTSPYFIGACVAAGLVGLAGWLAGGRVRTDATPVAVTRVEAERIARESLAARGVVLDDSWHVMPVLEDGRSKANQFLWEAAGDERFQALKGRYLTQPRWRVRVAAFDGDIANRAEEWIVGIGGRDKAAAAAAVAHQLPESRDAPSLDEEAARALAYRTVQGRFGLFRFSVREVSARPTQNLSRTDWTFTFQNLTVPPIPYAGSQGEARIAIQITGSEVTSFRPFISVPEQWLRDDRARQAPAVIVAMLAAGLTIGVLGTTVVLGLIAWTRRQFAVRAFLTLLSAFVVAALINAVNDWPARMASFTTAQPFQLQVLLSIANGCLPLLIPAAATALAAGAVTRSMSVHWSPRIAAIVGVSLGLVDAGVSTATDMIRGTQGPPWPDVSALGSYLPMLAAATEGIPDLLLQSVTLLVLLAGFHQLTRGWTTRRLLLAPLLVGAGLLLSGPPSGAGIPAWLVAGVVSGLGLLFFYILVLRHDLSLTPIAVGTTVALDHLQQGLRPAFPGAVVGALLGAVTTILVSWWLFGLLRHAHTLAVAGACDRDDVPIGATFTSASVPIVRA